MLLLSGKLFFRSKKTPNSFNNELTIALELCFDNYNNTKINIWSDW